MLRPRWWGLTVAHTIDSFDGRTWYVVVSKAKFENRAECNLELRDLAVWRPLCLVWRRHARRVEAVERSLFPRYLFVGLRPGQSVREADQTPGVAFVIRGWRGEPTQVRAAVLDEIRTRVEADGGALDLTPKPVERRFRLGQTLTVNEGPMAGWSGLYVASNEQRVTLLLDILGREVHTRIPARSVCVA